jgi:hypothetical protein
VKFSSNLKIGTVTHHRKVICRLNYNIVRKNSTRGSNIKPQNLAHRQGSEVRFSGQSREVSFLGFGELETAHENGTLISFAVILLRSLTCYWIPTQRIHQSCIPGTKHTTTAASWRLQHTDTASSAWWNQNVYSLESAPTFSSSSSSSETQICKRREQNLCGNPYGNRREPLDFVAHTLSLFLCSCASPCGLDGIDEEDDDERRHPKKKMTERM